MFFTRIKSPDMNSVIQKQWNSLAKCLHWLAVLLILVAGVLGFIAETADLSPAKLQLLVWHKSVGITLLIIMVLRLAWKRASSLPEQMAGLSKANQLLSNLGHWFIYLIAIFLPLSGWFLTSTANFPFQWFGVFAVPMPWAENEKIKDAASQAHFSLFYLLLVLIIGHVLMALKHQASGLPVLSRILPAKLGLAPLLFILALASALIRVAWIDSQGQLPASSEPITSSESANVDALSEPTSAASANWQLLASQSHLNFIGTYDSIDFQAGFTQFDPQISFYPQQLEQSRFDVRIDVTPVTTGSPDMDESVHEKDWFDFAAFPDSRYRAMNFEQLAEGQFIAKGV